MEIVPASILDLNSLRHVEHACFPKDAWPIFDLIAVLTFAGVIRLKMVEDGRMIGFVAGDVRTSEGISWVATLGILPEFRGKGFGRALLEACETQIPTSRVRLSVRESNEEAIRMYKNAGYYTINRWTGYYNDGEAAIVMEKVRL
jgi:ribosomal-protein-alanine N-acetyltransferase